MATTTTSFHNFPYLSIELRLHIWDTILSIPRIVSLTCTKNRPRLLAKSFSSSLRPPVLLHVCRESRLEALGRYCPSFTTEISPRYTYVCFSQDMIKCMDNLLFYLPKDELAKIETLSLRVTDLEYFSHYNMGILKSMSKLKDLELNIALDLMIQQSQNSNIGILFAREFLNDFEEERRSDPAWRCPQVCILGPNKDKLGSLPGGALVSELKL